MSTTKEKYLKLLEDTFIETQSATMDSLDLDATAKKEFISLIKSENIVKEIFINTLHLYLDDENLNEYMKLQLEMDTVKKEADKKLEGLSKNIQDITKSFSQESLEKSSKIITDFYQHNSTVIQTMIANSEKRKQPTEH